MNLTAFKDKLMTRMIPTYAYYIVSSAKNDRVGKLIVIRWNNTNYTSCPVPKSYNMTLAPLCCRKKGTFLPCTRYYHLYFFILQKPSGTIISFSAIVQL